MIEDSGQKNRSPKRLKEIVSRKKIMRKLLVRFTSHKEHNATQTSTNSAPPEPYQQILRDEGYWSGTAERIIAMDLILTGQLMAVAAAGSFMGEWYRGSCSGVPPSIPAVGFGSFLSFLMGWGVYEVTDRRALSVILCGLFSSQDIPTLMKIVKKLFVKNLDMLREEQDDE